MIKTAVAILFSMVSLGISAATTFSTDFSDLWWNQNESGWGANIAQQSSILFVTMFVYGPSGQPTWYIGSDVEYAGASGNDLLFTGALYQTSGPYFGGAFNPSAVGVRQVGQISFSFDSTQTGAVTYSVDGVSVTKIISRLTWAANNISGTYLGGDVGTFSGCAVNGYREEAATVTITQAGSNFVMSATGPLGTCSWTGTYGQSGRMGSASGTFACSYGGSGTFQAFEIEAGISGLMGRATSQYGGGCTWSGRFGGLRTGQ
jgi:hypothetical protein